MFRPVAPTLQDWLLERLITDLPTVACSLGYPAGGLADEQVWVAGEFDADLLRVVSGYGGRDEEGSLEVRISVIQTGNEYTPVRDRALEIAGVLEDILVEDPTMGGLCSVAQVAHAKASEAHPEDRKVQCGLSITITYLATVAAG